MDIANLTVIAFKFLKAEQQNNLCGEESGEGDFFTTPISDKPAKDLTKIKINQKIKST